MFSLCLSMRSKYLLVRAAQSLLFVPLINVKTGQRYSVVVRCSLITLAQNDLPYMFVGHSEPANCQLLYVFCLSLVVRVNMNRDPCSTSLWGWRKLQFHQFYQRGRSPL
jgi:hypothetical protein